MAQAVEIGFWARTSGELGIDGSLGWNAPAGRVAERLQLERRKQLIAMNSGRLSTLGMLVCAVAKLDQQADVVVYNRRGPLAISEPMRRGTFAEEPNLYVAVSMPEDAINEPDDRNLAELPIDLYAAMHNVSADTVRFAGVHECSLPPAIEQLTARYAIYAAAQSQRLE